MAAFFGPAGNSDAFSQKHKSSLDAPAYLREMGLDAYEYQCGKGVKISEETAQKLRKKSLENSIRLSLHAPYFISLSSIEPQKRENSINYILQSTEAALRIGADRIVIHSGSCAKISREEALELAKETLLSARTQAVEKGFGEIHFCPETMGKFNQLGDLDEVIELCGLDETFIPCIDFGHLNARTLGQVSTKEQFEEIFRKIEDKLGHERLKIFHSHFSKIEYTTNGGEKKHLTFEDEAFGPPFEPMLELVAKKQLSPVIICESAGTQDADALAMKNYYMSLNP